MTDFFFKPPLKFRQNMNQELCPLFKPQTVY